MLNRNAALVIALAAVSLSGCGSHHELAKCKGPLIALNSSQWTPTPQEMAALAKACPEDE